MSGSIFFFAKSKSFEFSVEGGTFYLLHIYERGRDSLLSGFMGKESAKWLLSMVEDFISSKSPRDLARTVRDGYTIFS